jgi:hypothetical protein
VLKSWPRFGSAASFRWWILVLVVLAAGLVSPPAQASKAKKKKQVSYFGRVTASGEWQKTSTCETTYMSSWQLEALYDKTGLEDTATLDMTTGGASGRIDWTNDHCNGTVETGQCSVGLDDFVLPAILDQAKGGLKVDFQLSLVGVGCTPIGPANVPPYGAGFGTSTAVIREPQGFIPSKKIGRKVIKVPLDGNASGSAGPGRTFSGHMSGTLTLTVKKPIQALPF